MNYITKHTHRYPEKVEAIQAHCEAKVEGLMVFSGDWILSNKEQDRYSARVFTMSEADFRVVYMADKEEE